VREFQRSQGRSGDGALAGFFAAVLKNQCHCSAKALYGFRLRAALAVGFRDFRAKGREPFAFAVNFGGESDGR
jgi:hypothetical protein